MQLDLARPQGLGQLHDELRLLVGRHLGAAALDDHRQRGGRGERGERGGRGLAQLLARAEDARRALLGRARAAVHYEGALVVALALHDARDAVRGDAKEDLVSSKSGWVSEG
eukprot:scaffold117894_cov36-Phaeocystis_antarctica.AAC.3